MSAPQLQREVAEGDTEDGGQLLRRLLSQPRRADAPRASKDLDILLSKPIATLQLRQERRPRVICQVCGDPLCDEWAYELNRRYERERGSW